MAGKTFPAFPAHARPAILRIWQEAHFSKKQNVLCLIRAVAIYMDHTQWLVSKDPLQKLFIYFQTNTQVLTSHFRLWVTETIDRTYEAALQQRPDKVNANEVRAVAASIAYYKRKPWANCVNLLAGRHKTCSPDTTSGTWQSAKTSRTYPIYHWWL